MKSQLGLNCRSWAVRRINPYPECETSYGQRSPCRLGCAYLVQRLRRHENIAGPARVPLSAMARSLAWPTSAASAASRIARTRFKLFSTGHILMNFAVADPVMRVDLAPRVCRVSVCRDAAGLNRSLGVAELMGLIPGGPATILIAMCRSVALRRIAPDGNIPRSKAPVAVMWPGLDRRRSSVAPLATSSTRQRSHCWSGPQSRACG
jgi:hypothetical protein